MSPTRVPGRVYLAMLALCVLLALATVPLQAMAQANADPAPLQFTDTAEERRFHDLVAELRCVMCQNQSLADSDAQIAHDLRREVLELMQSGRSDDEIKDFLVARYGEFVLYRPELKSNTWLLWFGPALVLLAGGVAVILAVRRRGARMVPEDDGQEW